MRKTPSPSEYGVKLPSAVAVSQQTKGVTAGSLFTSPSNARGASSRGLSGDFAEFASIAGSR
jgi:hypothetical protein